MFKNYITIALRHLKRQPGYTLLNVLGFTIGLVSSFLIILYLFNELSYDKHNEKAERVFRISSDFTEPDNTFRWAVTQLPLAKAVKNEIAEIEYSSRLIRNGRSSFEVNSINYLEDDMYYADSTLFDIFSYNIIAGDIETALDAPNSIVLSESVSKRLFKSENPLNQIIKVDDLTLKVTGIYKDLPTTTHVIPKGLISSSTEERHNRQNWGSFGIYTYVLLKENADVSVVDNKLDDILVKYVDVIFDQFDVKVEYELINIQKIHLASTFEGEPEPLGSIKYIYIFAAIAAFLILIACINYMNLSTARSIKRSLEVGVRKVMGAKRGALAFQFMAESIILTLGSLILSLVLLTIIVPLLNNQLELSLNIYNLIKPEIIFLCLGVLILTGLISGSYPAFFLSSFKPIVALKGKGSSRKSNQSLRRVLVGLQFALSIFMLVGTFVIYQQMQFLSNKDLGFDKDKILKVVLNSENARDKWPVFKNKLQEKPYVINASTSTSSPGSGFSKNLIGVETNEGMMEEYGVDLYAVDYDYFDVLNVSFVEGRNISSEFPSDTASAVLVNEAMVKRMGWENPIGKKFQFDNDSTKFHKVVGVVSDFHQQSLYNPIEALMFYPQLNNHQAMIKISGDINKAIKGLESSWQEIYPGIPFEYTFLDEEFMSQYNEDQLRGKLFLGFALMMIFISCLGLLGLASFIAEQRTKEISVRKVLGANIAQLVSLLVKDFLLLLIIGAIPAFALGYYFMNEWLSNFEYHININFFVFLIVLLIISTITIITTGFHAYRAAIANPSDNLRYE